MIELLIFFSSFIIAGIIATKIMNVAEKYSCFLLTHMDIKIVCNNDSSYCLYVGDYCTIWKTTIVYGIKFTLNNSGVLIANTPLWLVYPYCYSGYVVSDALHTVTTTGTGSTISLFPFIPCAVIISALALYVSIKCFGRKEMR